MSTFAINEILKMHAYSPGIQRTTILFSIKNFFQKKFFACYKMDVRNYNKRWIDITHGSSSLKMKTAYLYWAIETWSKLISFRGWIATGIKLECPLTNGRCQVRILLRLKQSLHFLIAITKFYKNMHSKKSFS